MSGNRGLKTAAAVVLFTLAFASLVFAGDAAAKKDSTKDASAFPAVQAADPNAMRLEGEKRFRANCGRCHAAPQKFPPRMMATVLRHMRVRATITDQDMRLVLFYMTQ